MKNFGAKFKQKNQKIDFKKKVLPILIAILACGLLSALVEVVGFNFKIITLGNDNPSQLLDFTTTKTTDEDGDKIIIITTNAENHYINKFIITYNTTERTEYQIAYTHPGTYGLETTTGFSDVFDTSLPGNIVNFNTNVSNIAITYKLPKNEDGAAKQNPVTIESIAIDNDFHFNFTRTIFIFFALITFYLILYFYKDGYKTQKLHIYFATFSLLIGAMIITVQPASTFYSYDDQIHFETVVGLLNRGRPFTVGEYHASNAYILDSVGRENINSIDEQYSQENILNSTEPSPYTVTISRRTLYNKVAYLPMAIGYHAAKFIHLPFVACFKIGKIFNLLVYVILVAYAIKKIKIGKALLTIIALFPTNLFLASSYSYDPAVFAGIAVFIAELTNLFVDKTTKITPKTVIIMLASLFYAGLTKAVYAPLLLLALFIPKDRFKTVKQSRWIKAGFIVATLLLLATFVLPAITGTAASDPRGGDTSTSEQLSLIISHPIDYAKVLGDNAVAQFGGRFLGSNTLIDLAYITTDQSNLYFILLILVIFFFFTDNHENKLTAKQRWGIGGANLVTIIFIWTALYLAYTPVGYSVINGVQNRYFLPLLFSFLLCIQPRKIKHTIPEKAYNAIAIITPTVVMVIIAYSAILLPYAC